MKSHTGCTFHLGRHSASFKSITKKQTVLADSSTVAEYVAAHLGAKEIMWIRNFLFELGFEQQHATTLFEDNQSTIKLIGKPGNGNKTKHIDLRFNFIREQVAQDVVTMEYLLSCPRALVPNGCVFMCSRRFHEVLICSPCSPWLK